MRAALLRAGRQPLPQRRGGSLLADQIGGRRPPDVVTPVRQQREQRRIPGVSRAHPPLFGERVKQPIGPGDGVQGLTTACRPNPEVRHGRIPSP